VYASRQELITALKFHYPDRDTNELSPLWIYRFSFTPLNVDGTVTETHVGVEAPEDDGWEQDPDTLDTWFSSGTWTFSTLGWPRTSPAGPVQSQPAEKKGDLATFHPTSVLETGYDILFFWVARMILMSQFALQEVPFKTVYLHGLVRDKDRQKMSKSRGNVVDPLGIAEEYGADALRMALLFGTGLGGDTVISEEKVRGMRNFATKLWNIARFVVTNTTTDERITNYGGDKNRNSYVVTRTSISPITAADEEILKQLANTTDIVTRSLEDYRFHVAAEKLYDFIWGTFAATYLEAAKGQLRVGQTSEVFGSLTSEVTGPADPELADNTRAILLHVLKQSVTLLHPFMPFVTEAIWQQLGADRASGDLEQRRRITLLSPDDSELLISQRWPVTDNR
jgi:valyl-tRNA synthetase